MIRRDFLKTGLVAGASLLPTFSLAATPSEKCTWKIIKVYQNEKARFLSSTSQKSLYFYNESIWKNDEPFDYHIVKIFRPGQEKLILEQKNKVLQQIQNGDFCYKIIAYKDGLIGYTRSKGELCLHDKTRLSRLEVWEL